MRDGWTPGALLDGEPRVWRSRTGYTVRRIRAVGDGTWMLCAWAPATEHDRVPRTGYLGAYADGADGFAAAEKACREHWSAGA